jgi:hypothetical protein
MGDNGISVLTAADYCQCRLVPIIDYYERRSPILSRRLGFFTTVMVLLTAITTGMSLSSHLKMWVPLVVAFGAAIATTLEWCVQRVICPLYNLTFARQRPPWRSILE